ncbi:MAG TPA: ATP-binding protein [Planctomycetota bacterium]|nr:ATP-binding protein [Planctomycetota bacterium]
MGLFWPGLGVGLALGAAGAVAYFLKALRGLRRAERRARDSERLAYLGSLAGGLAHEIKNPLSTLHMNLQLLEEDVRKSGGDRAQRDLGRIKVLRREVRRLEEVLEDFLRYARRHQLELEAQNVNDILAEILDFVTPEASRTGVRVSRGLTPDLQSCRVDAGQLKQAFLNIVINAKQAMPDGGELIVHTKNVPKGIEIEFIDTGTGISDDDLPRIWDVYYSSKKTGTGLGLPTARRIIEEHGGTIRVDTEVGKGTCFTVFLPTQESGQ